MHDAINHKDQGLSQVEAIFENASMGNTGYRWQREKL
jgi:hypothetical protein